MACNEAVWVPIACLLVADGVGSHKLLCRRERGRPSQYVIPPSSVWQPSFLQRVNGGVTAVGLWLRDVLAAWGCCAWGAQAAAAGTRWAAVQAAVTGTCDAAVQAAARRTCWAAVHAATREGSGQCTAVTPAGHSCAVFCACCAAHKVDLIPRPSHHGVLVLALAVCIGLPLACHAALGLEAAGEVDHKGPRAAGSSGLLSDDGRQPRLGRLPLAHCFCGGTPTHPLGH